MAGRMRVKKIEVDAGIQEAVLAFALSKAVELADEAGPRIVDAARGRVKESTAKTAARALAGRSTNPQKRSLQKAQLRPESQFQGDPGYRRFIYVNPESEDDDTPLTRAGLIKQLKKAGGVTKSPNITKYFQGTRKGGTLGKSPDLVIVKGNTLKGVFSNRGTGTLASSIHYAGAEVVDRSVIAEVIAEAPYALYVHEGFTHRGGKHHQGAATHIPANPFLRSALDVNGRQTVGG